MSEDQKLTPKVELPARTAVTPDHEQVRPVEQAAAETAQERPQEVARPAVLPPATITTDTPSDLIAASNAAAREREQEKKVEKILEADLAGIYIAMPEDKKLEFKTVGERTAKEINRLLKEAKVQAKRIVDLIIAWLKIIPGVNKYFVEQEAKIKADELVKLNKLTKEKGGDK